MANDDKNQNENVADENRISKNENLEAHKKVKEQESNGKESSDPSAQRNVGANGYTQRSDQKDQLENLSIGGSESTPQGGNSHQDAQAQGPGFETEGSYELDHSVRTQEQEFGEAKPSGESSTPQDGSISN